MIPFKNYFGVKVKKFRGNEPFIYCYNKVFFTVYNLSGTMQSPEDIKITR